MGEKLLKPTYGLSGPTSLAMVLVQKLRERQPRDEATLKDEWTRHGKGRKSAFVERSSPPSVPNLVCLLLLMIELL